MKKIIACRDPRFDGRFYFGVRTTRIYCRPICPARPKPENILIFRSASEAELAGYRPCRRCRPDAAPGSKLFDGTLSTVSRALRLMQTVADGDRRVEALAASLGVTDRHLRRLFDEHLGASPVEILTTQRLHFAKQTLLETSLPVSEIAFAAGFQSIRRFNEAFKERFHASPTTYRQKVPKAPDAALELRAPIRLPYDWRTVLAYLRRHETFGVERVTDDSYRRFVPVGKTFGEVRVRHDNGPFLRVEFVDVPIGGMRPLLGRVKALFDADHDPGDLPQGGLKANGIRVPGSFDPFETAVSVVLSQLVTTANATLRLRKLVEAFGRRIGVADGLPVMAFPIPKVLAKAPLESLGLTRAMAGALRELSRQVASGELDFSAPLDFAAAAERLMAIKGIGPWTTSMIAMRCLGDPDAFPEADLIVRRALDLKLAAPVAWRPSRAYLVHCLWRDLSSTLSKKGASS